MSAARDVDNSVTFTVTGMTRWQLTFAAPDQATLVPGVYDDAVAYPHQPPGRPGLRVGANGRGCGTLTGRFVVLEAVYVQGSLQRLAVDFEHHCEGAGPALFGRVRYNSSVALPLRVFAEGGSATEGGGSGVVLKVRLSGPSASPVTVDYATFDGSAVGDVDYVRSYGTLIIPAGASEALVTVPPIDDALYEETETFGLQITRAAGAQIAGDWAVGTVVDDDSAPVVSLGDVSIREGDPGRPGTARVQVTLDQPSARTVTLIYGTLSGTAVAGQDFVVRSGSLAIGPGQTTATIDVLLRAELLPEGDEALTVALFTASNAQIGTARAEVTIEDDDGPTDFYTLTPCRLLDSRQAAGTIPANGSLTFAAGGQCGVPPTAKAVVLNVTAVEPSTAGHLRLGPAGTPVPRRAP